MKSVVLSYNDLSKWNWRSDKQATVYVDGVNIGTYTGIRPTRLLQIVRNRLGVKKVKSRVVQKISPVQKAKSDLEYKVMAVCCPVPIFWENVGRDKKAVEDRLVDISKIEDENVYNEALESLMNEYI